VGLREEKCIYLDAFGILASAGNLLFLQAANASAGQMRFWDNCLVPISRVMDRAFAFSLAGPSWRFGGRRPNAQSAMGPKVVDKWQARADSNLRSIT